MTDPHFELWLVDNVKDGPAAMRITVLAGPQLARLLARAKEHRYWTIPVPISEYARARCKPAPDHPTRPLPDATSPNT